MEDELLESQRVAKHMVDNIYSTTSSRYRVSQKDARFYLFEKKWATKEKSENIKGRLGWSFKLQLYRLKSKSQENSRLSCQLNRLEDLPTTKELLFYLHP